MELYTLANESSSQLQGHEGWQFDTQISGGCRVEHVLSCYRTVLQISTKLETRGRSLIRASVINEVGNTR